MAIYPKAVKKLIPPGSNDPRIKPRVAILHVDAGNASSLYDYFAHRSGGIEAHFFVKADGTVEQYRDTDFQADANLNANDFAVSIETQGYAAGEWTDAQLAAIKDLLSWLHTEHDIPLRKCNAWNGSGVGYHVQFGSPGPWTPVAKSCPGPNRIRQFNDVLVPWFNQADKPKTRWTRGKRVDRIISATTREARKAKAQGRARKARVLNGAANTLKSLARWRKK